MSAHRLHNGILLIFVLLLAFSLFVLTSCQNTTTSAPESDTDTDTDTDTDNDTDTDSDIDENEGLIPESAIMIESDGGYSGLLRSNNLGALIFSPNLDELHSLDISNFTFRLTFTLKNSDGKEVYSFAPLNIVPTPSTRNEWYDFTLISANFNCGFCPTAGSAYDIFLEVLEENEVKYYRNFASVTCPKLFGSSIYYSPTVLPENPSSPAQYMIHYVAESYAGKTIGTIQGEAHQKLKNGESSSLVVAVPNEGYIFESWSDGNTNAQRQGDTAFRSKTIFAIFKAESSFKTFPSIYLELTEEDYISSKAYYTPGTIKVVDPSDHSHDFTQEMEVRGRGNSSWSSDPQDEYNSKNSYRLKLSEKEKLLGIGNSKNSDWVLQSNKFDVSNLRNYTIWSLAEQMGTLPYVSSCAWAHLYVNGEYRGLYMVCEQIEIANDRVEVTKTGSGESQGYLLELDFRGNKDGVEGVDYFYIDGFEPNTDNKREWVIKNKEIKAEDYDYISSYMQSVHEAMMSADRDRIDALVDIPSMIDMFILEELSKDCDVGGASMFFQKDAGGKLYFTCPWDYDFGFGTYYPATVLTNFVCERDSSKGECLPWFQNLLYNTDWFKSEVLARMKELDSQNAIEKTIAAVTQKASYLKDAADANDELWGVYANNYHPYVSRQVSGKLKDYGEHLEFLISWTQNRWNWIEENIMTAKLN